MPRSGSTPRAARPAPGVVGTIEAMVVAALPDLGALVDVLRHPTGPASQHVRRIFAQFADGTQLDLAVVAEAEIEARRRGGGAPDFVSLYQAPAAAAPDRRMPGRRRRPAVSRRPRTRSLASRSGNGPSSAGAR